MAELTKLPVILDPFLHLLGGLLVQIEIDGLAPDFPSPLVVGPMQDTFGDAAAVGLSAPVLAPLNGPRNDVTQRLDLRFRRFVVLAKPRQLFFRT